MLLAYDVYNPVVSMETLMFIWNYITCSMEKSIMSGICMKKLISLYGQCIILDIICQ